MKKLMVLLVALVAMQGAVLAGNDRPIAIAKLPLQAQQFINEYFPGVEVSYAKVDNDVLSKDYEVIFVNGDKIEFDHNGKWTDVKSRTQLPDGIVPSAIVDYVEKQHKGMAIKGIERDRRYYEVKLANGLDIKFNMKYAVVGCDD